MGVDSAMTVSRAGSMRVLTAQMTSGPVACVDVVVHDDDQFRVGELAQVGPDAEHDAARVSRILLADADHGDPVGAGFAGQIEILDFWELGLEDRHEHVVQCETQH